MKLQVTKNLENSVYSSKFEIIERNTFDDDLLADYAGSTNLNVGGNVYKITVTDDGSGTPVEEMTLLLEQGDRFLPFAECIPFERAWSIAQYGDKTKAIAEAYTAQMTKRIVSLVDELKLKGDSFSDVSQIILTP